MLWTLSERLLTSTYKRSKWLIKQIFHSSSGPLGLSYWMHFYRHQSWVLTLRIVLLEAQLNAAHHVIFWRSNFFETHSATWWPVEKWLMLHEWRCWHLIWSLKTAPSLESVISDWIHSCCSPQTRENFLHPSFKATGGSVSAPNNDFASVFFLSRPIEDRHSSSAATDNGIYWTSIWLV